MNEEKTNLDQGNIATCMAVGGFIVMILSPCFAALFGPTGTFISLTIAVISMIMGVIEIIAYNSNDKAAHIANINSFQAEYDKYANELGIVKSDTEVTLFESDKYDFEEKISHYLWIAYDCIRLFPKAEYYKYNRTSSVSRPDISELKLKSIPIDSILYFEEVGELRKYTTISGGGTSLKGALLGYAIAEDVGAIIGSREPITTNVVSEDDRRIELIYKNKDGQIENLEFKHDAYNVFKKLMPLKELRKIVSLNSVEGTKEHTVANKRKPKTVKEKLKQLNELKAEGLITEEEFSEQKKKILESL